jgi:hypothetical protein
MKSGSLLALSLLALAPSTAWANYICAGAIDNVGVDVNGSVSFSSFSVGFSYVTLCSVNAATNGIPVSACQAMFATLLRAQATGAQVQWAFDDSLTCATHPAWIWLTGLYWGPQVITQ